jgi:hypothetical protein
VADRTTWDTQAGFGDWDVLLRAASTVDRLLGLAPALPQLPEQEREIAALLDAALKELNAA